MRLFFFILIHPFFFLHASAQDTILTMSGYEISCSNISFNDFEVHFEKVKKNGKSKSLKMHVSEVFSVTRNGVDSVLYVQDPMLGDDFSEQEMRIFIAGQQDARNNYKSWPTFAVGAAAGAGVAILAAGAFMATLAVPVVYPVAQLLPVIKIQESTISDPNHRYNEIYASGYERVARSRKVIAGLKGAAIGTLIGVGVFYGIMGGEE